MSQNINQFALYSAKIFELLYDSFPVPLSISKDEVIAQYLTFDQDKELKELKMQQGIAEISIMTEDEELKARAIKNMPAFAASVAKLKQKQRLDRNQQEEIYGGTLTFLLCEGIIRECNRGTYQLTSKGFSHLNKSFKDGSINEAESTNISALKAIFKTSADTSVQVASGVAVNVITRILGYS
jgi:hypothetical protein